MLKQIIFFYIGDFIMALVGSKAPSWEAPVYDNGEQKHCPVMNWPDLGMSSFFGHLILLVFVTLK